MTPENLVHPKLFEALKQYEGCMYSMRWIDSWPGECTVAVKLTDMRMTHLCDDHSVQTILVYPNGADKEPVTFHTKDY